MRNKILFYDIETLPLKAYVWGLGKQVIRHGQLDQQHKMYRIICITYCWNDGKKAKAIIFEDDFNNRKMIKEFDKLVDKADVVIGKNSDRFDNKHINIQRILNNLPGKSHWTKYTDDLEKHMRRNFYLPSYTLDYFSDLLGFGGKNPMVMKDWINILEKTRGWKQSLKKMVDYGKKDILDTRAIWEYCEKHFEPKLNVSALNQDLSCKVCGSHAIVKNGTRASGKTLYQNYFCNDHGGYAGRHPAKQEHPKLLG